MQCPLFWPISKHVCVFVSLYLYGYVCISVLMGGGRCTKQKVFISHSIRLITAEIMDALWSTKYKVYFVILYGQFVWSQIIKTAYTVIHMRSSSELDTIIAPSLVLLVKGAQKHLPEGNMLNSSTRWWLLSLTINSALFRALLLCREARLDWETVGLLLCLCFTNWWTWQYVVCSLWNVYTTVLKEFSPHKKAHFLQETKRYCPCLCGCLWRIIPAEIL